MRFFWKLLVLFFLVFSPCLVGCSSQLSEEEAERLEAEEEDDEDPDEFLDDESEESGDE